MGFIFDASSKGITIEDLELDQVSLVTSAGVGELVDHLTALRDENYAADARG
jgi:hypothetical protein